MASIREAQRFHQEVLDSHGNEKESIDRLRKMWLESEQEHERHIAGEPVQ